MSQNPNRKQVRVWVDGCFDMMHHGHANALRQAKAMGDFLVVGVHSDEEIEKHKGPTVMKEEERYTAVEACKWADLVVKDAPYFTSLEVMEKYNCDFCVHGDDITTLSDGTDCYQAVKDAGKYRECKRTQGISTTELVGRILLMTRDHHKRRSSIASINNEDLTSFSSNIKHNPEIKISHCLPTSKKIVQFSEGREPEPGDKVVYVDGTFDLFHVGHIEFLKRAKSLGNYLLVGIHDDQTVNAIKGVNFPLMNLHERVLSVLACRYVDEVILGAPYSVDENVLSKVYKVDIVAHGNTPSLPDVNGKDPYELPKALGIYVEIENPSAEITTDGIINRIIEHRKMYEERQARKNEKAKLEEERLNQK
ncbi:Nucleotidylyl transferase [Rhizophagus irregularis]|uniref:ethanolamine-phosphate cytidylyltransferase n=1 Tax=Rhizophagus irregularis TaxID=588596 RepID=A0A2N0Q502_9GLOM|nr:Nucleotidylyl transferase [Rhizophagus irregularis]